MTQSIAKYEETIERLSCYAPEGCGNIAWPVGVPPPFKPPTRFDVLRWDYFNETHIYLKSDNDVIDLMKRKFFFIIENVDDSIEFFFVVYLSADDYEDVHEVIDHAVEQFRKKYGVE